MEEGSLWVKVIKEIHGVDGGLSNTSRSCHTGVWMGIIKVKQDLNKKGVVLSDAFSRKVGNGNDTCFWSDLWIGENV